jgi:hypothetical protein
METEGDVSQDRGQLLFDETEMDSFKNAKRRDLWYMIVLLVPGTIFGWLFLRGLVLGSLRDLITASLGILGCTFGVFLGWRGWKSTYPTKVYENGIVIGWRTKEMREQGKDDYVPFERIDEVYLNGEFAYKLKNEKPKRALRFDRTFDTEAFYRSLEGKVKIERNIRIGPDNQMVWKSPDDLQIESLGFQLQWRDKRRQVMFDDITGLIRRRKFAVVTPRDGDEFAIRLNRESLRRLEKAWIEFQDRFWDDPEAEEERWERLEAHE